LHGSVLCKPWWLKQDEDTPPDAGARAKSLAYPLYNALVLPSSTRSWVQKRTALLPSPITALHVLTHTPQAVLLLRIFFGQLEEHGLMNPQK
jgi:hypothetical protein